MEKHQQVVSSQVNGLHTCNLVYTSGLLTGSCTNNEKTNCLKRVDNLFMV